MYIKHFFPKFNQAVLFQRKRKAIVTGGGDGNQFNDDDDGDHSYPGRDFLDSRL